MRYDFASDNTAGIAPEALHAIVAANEGFCSSYGTDSVCSVAADLIRGLLDVDAPVYFVGSGTAANAICLAGICRPYDSVLAHADSHVINEETGAPAHFGQGIGFIGLEGGSGRIAEASLAAALAMRESAHRQCPGAVSITNATEYGTVYSADHIRSLTNLAKARGLGVHLDGARMANAAAAGFDMRTLKSLNLDTAVIGGTKSGMPATEAIVPLDPNLANRFSARLKQTGQLASKSRFLAAPWIGMLRDGQWQRHALHANAMARKLAARVPLEVAHPVETNSVFVRMELTLQKRLMDSGWASVRAPDGSVRLMTSWATTEASIEAISSAVESLL